MQRLGTLRLQLATLLVVVGVIWFRHGAGEESARVAAHSDGMEVSELLHQVQVGLVHAQNRLGSDMPRLKKVQLELETQLVDEGGGKVKLFVISAGGTVSATTAQRVVLSLAPPDEFAEVESAASQLSEIFAESVVAAVKGAYQATQRKPKLEMEQLVSEIKFTVTKEGEGGFNFVIAPVTVEAGVGTSSSAVQRLIVTFGS